MASTLAVSGSDDEDVVAFVVGDAHKQTLLFSKRALTQHSSYFRRYFARHADDAAVAVRASGGATVALKHVQPRCAEAALRLCSSADQSDDAAFWLLLRECERLDAARESPPPLRAVLSLYAACIKFDLPSHATAASATAAAAVTRHSVYDVVRTCARYATTLPPATRRAVGLHTLLAACAGLMPASGPQCSERRWRRLHEQYPELLEVMAAVRGAAVAAASPVPTTSTTTATAALAGAAAAAAAVSSTSSTSSPTWLRGALVSARTKARHATTAAGDVTAVAVAARAAPPSPGQCFAGHLLQTEALALAAQRRWRAMTAEVASVRESCAALQATAQRDEAAAAEATLYLSEVRVYVQALRSAQAELAELCTAAEAAACPSPSPPSGQSASALHALRHTLQCAAASATERRTAVEELLEVEQVAVGELDAELQRLRADMC